MARLHVPLSTLRRRPYDRLRMTRGQGNWLGLPCTTLSFATPRRFSTAHIAVGTGLAASPPHGPVQAALPHTVLTSGGLREGQAPFPPPPPQTQARSLCSVVSQVLCSHVTSRERTRRDCGHRPSPAGPPGYQPRWAPAGSPVSRARSFHAC